MAICSFRRLLASVRLISSELKVLFRLANESSISLIGCLEICRFNWRMVSGAMRYLARTSPFLTGWPGCTFKPVITPLKGISTCLFREHWSLPWITISRDCALFEVSGAADRAVSGKNVKNRADTAAMATAERNVRHVPCSGAPRTDGEFSDDRAIGLFMRHLHLMRLMDRWHQLIPSPKDAVTTKLFKSSPERPRMASTALLYSSFFARIIFFASRWVLCSA